MAHTLILWIFTHTHASFASTFFGSFHSIMMDNTLFWLAMRTIDSEIRLSKLYSDASALAKDVRTHADPDTHMLDQFACFFYSFLFIFWRLIHRSMSDRHRMNPSISSLYVHCTPYSQSSCRPFAYTVDVLYLLRLFWTQSLCMRIIRTELMQKTTTFAFAMRWTKRTEKRQREREFMHVMSSVTGSQLQLCPSSQQTHRVPMNRLKSKSLKPFLFFFN